MPTIHDATWPQIEGLRASIEANLEVAPTLVDAADALCAGLATAYSTVALARVFLVVPYKTLPPAEQAVAAALATTLGRTGDLEPTTPVLSLLATRGVEAAWTKRESSAGHRAIPLLDARFVEGAPMVAALLASLRVDLAALRGDPSVELRKLAGGLNARFYVPDAQTTLDARGRHIIAARDFVSKYRVRSVFGMGGAYMSGALIVAIVFTTEVLTPAEIDRFPSFIGSFKITTAKLVERNALFAPSYA